MERFVHTWLQHRGQSSDGHDKRVVAHMCFVLETALQTWRHEASMSSACLRDAYSARHSHPLCRNLSLVVVPAPAVVVGGGGDSSDAMRDRSVEGVEARFVHWQERGSTGRPVELDKDHRVKALVCVGALRVAWDLSNAYVIHPDTGIQMQRARGFKSLLRPQMSPSLLRLQAVCQKALLDADNDVDEDTDPVARSWCSLCKERLDGVPYVCDLGQGQMSRCICCLQSLGQ